MTLHPLRSTLFVATVLLAACYSSLEVREQRVVGVVSFHSEPIVIDLPDSVTLDVPFLVEVTTYGGGCERIGETEVRVETGAVVIPFDYTSAGPGIVCTDQLKLFRHEAMVTLDRAGQGTVTVRGRVEPGGNLRDFPRAVWVE